jgi:hypothetical protein
MAGYQALKSLLLRDRKRTRPPLLIASARKPSSFTSTTWEPALGEPFHSLQEHGFR